MPRESSFSVARGSAQLLRVLVVSDHDATLLGLCDYLRGAGIVVRATRRLADVRDQAADLAAIVLFPDDFEADEVIAEVRQLLGSLPPLQVLVVTEAPARFAAVGVAEVGRAPVVIAKPAWGWTILDILRPELAP